jgi:hypothetical protein
LSLPPRKIIIETDSKAAYCVNAQPAPIRAELSSFWRPEFKLEIAVSEAVAIDEDITSFIKHHTMMQNVKLQDVEISHSRAEGWPKALSCFMPLQIIPGAGHPGPSGPRNHLLLIGALLDHL